MYIYIQQHKILKIKIYINLILKVIIIKQLVRHKLKDVCDENRQGQTQIQVEICDTQIQAFSLIVDTQKHYLQSQGCQVIIYNNKERGSHQIEAFSNPVKKNLIKFSKDQYQIPMTLFYDQSDKVYLKKQIIVKSYICDQSANVIKKIGQTELDIAQYAANQKFALQIEVENQKSKEEAVITFQMFMQRHDDDSKSVYTMSEQQFQLKSKDLGDSKKDRKSKSKQKNNFLFPIAQSTVSVKSAQQKLKKSFVSQIDQKYSQQTNRRKNTPIKQLKRLDEVNQNNRKNESQDQNQNYFYKKFQQEDKNIQSKNISESIPKSNQKNYKKQKQKSTVDTAKQYQYQRRSKNISTDNQGKKANISSLQSFTLNKKVVNLQKQNNSLKNEVLNLKSVIQQLLKQKSKKQIIESTSTNQSKQQIDYYKNIIVEKQCRIHELESLNKIVNERQEKKDKQIINFKNEIKDLRLKLQHQKNKLAKVLQNAMENENVELLEIVQNQLSDQYY